MTIIVISLMITTITKIMTIIMAIMVLPRCPHARGSAPGGFGQARACEASSRSPPQPGPQEKVRSAKLLARSCALNASLGPGRDPRFYLRPRGGISTPPLAADALHHRSNVRPTRATAASRLQPTAAVPGGASTRIFYVALLPLRSAK